MKKKRDKDFERRKKILEKGLFGSYIRGLGRRTWDGKTDAQEYINKLREDREVI